MAAAFTAAYSGRYQALEHAIHSAGRRWLNRKQAGFIEPDDESAAALQIRTDQRLAVALDEITLLGNSRPVAGARVSFHAVPDHSQQARHAERPFRAVRVTVVADVDLDTHCHARGIRRNEENMLLSGKTGRDACARTLEGSVDVAPLPEWVICEEMPIPARDAWHERRGWGPRPGEAPTVLPEQAFEPLPSEVASVCTSL